MAHQHQEQQHHQSAYDFHDFDYRRSQHYLCLHLQVGHSILPQAQPPPLVFLKPQQCFNLQFYSTHVSLMTNPPHQHQAFLIKKLKSAGQPRANSDHHLHHFDFRQDQQAD